MRIAVQGRNVDVPAELRQAAEEKVNRVGRFLDGIDRAEVRFSEERNPRVVDREVCEVTMHGHGHVVRARGAAADPFTAVDQAVHRLEHRVQRLRGRLGGRSLPAGVTPVNSQVDATGIDDAPDPGPLIVKTKRFDMTPMTPEEAALHMDLVGHDFYVFTNAETGSAAVVYRRNDGHIGLIDAG